MKDGTSYTLKELKLLLTLARRGFHDDGDGRYYSYRDLTLSGGDTPDPEEREARDMKAALNKLESALLEDITR